MRWTLLVVLAVLAAAMVAGGCQNAKKAGAAGGGGKAAMEQSMAPQNIPGVTPPKPVEGKSGYDAAKSGGDKAEEKTTK